MSVSSSPPAVTVSVKVMVPSVVGAVNVGVAVVAPVIVTAVPEVSAQEYVIVPPSVYVEPVPSSVTITPNATF